MSHSTIPMDLHTKLYGLFYSLDAANRSLAFELAKGHDCYGAFVEELYQNWEGLHWFDEEARYALEEYQADYPDEKEAWPAQQYALELFARYYFDTQLSLKGTSEQKLTAFPSVLLHCTFLERLDISWNDLQRLPEDIDRLTRLRDLDLACNNELRQLPASLAHLPQLEKLSLYGIQGIFDLDEADQNYGKRQLPEFFRNMPSLRQLDLGDVLLDGFPEWMPELTQLEEILIFSGWGSHPRLEIPRSFAKMPRLKSLFIRSYSIAIPDNIHQLQSLEHLVVEPALVVPSSIAQLKQLKTLDLSYLSSDYPIHLEGYNKLWDLYNQGMPEGISRLKIYGWEWLKEMTWLEEFTFVHIEPYAFTELEKQELAEALPNCSFVFEEG